MTDIAPGTTPDTTPDTSSAIRPDSTLAEIVTERPALAVHLERLGLDYCCHGERTLADAVAAGGLALDDVVATLERAGRGETRADWADLGPVALVDHIESTHHAYLHEELPRLVALATKVAAVHGTRHPELAAVHRLTIAVRDDLEPHLRKEEMVLFPAIRRLFAGEAQEGRMCGGSLATPISVMLAEHDRAGELLAELRAATDGYRTPADACGSYHALYEGLDTLEADTHLHVHKENHLLFPAVLAAESGTH